MTTGRLILLNILIFAIGLLGYLLYTEFSKEPPPAATDPSGQDAVVDASNVLGSKLVMYIFGAAAVGLLLVLFVLPALAGAVSNFFYSAPEKVDPGLGGAAVAKIAQGDFPGAIEEYKKLIDENPTDRFPIVEVSKIYLERLGDPDAAVEFLEDSLNEKEWPVDDAAFLMFRIVDIEHEQRGNDERACELLTMITDNMENTRHAANAQAKLDQISAANRLPPKTEPTGDIDRLPPRT